MRLSFAVLVSLAVVVSEISASMMSPAHARIARRMTRKKRCIERGQNVANSDGTTVPPADNSNPAPSSPATLPAPPSPPPPPPPPPSSGVIQVQSTCGDIGASTNSDRWTGPNGASRWLTCGIDAGGWQPPNIGVHDLVYKSLDQVLGVPGNPFAGCGEFLGLFNQYGAEFDLPPILIASIAMQESSCRPWAIGGGGEMGLMQITPDKCGGAPNGDCLTPWFNIRTGAAYLRSRLDANGGNILVSVGEYNGWSRGLTYDRATAARYTSCCKCQNNLDYPHNLFNGWLQGVYPDTFGTPIWNNLAGC